MGWVPLYHYTMPAAAPFILKGGFRMSTQGQGDGERILKRVEQRARGMGLDSIFVLTTRTMHWFIKRGFVQVDPEWLPDARKRKYNWDRRSQVLVKKLG